MSENERMNPTDRIHAAGGTEADGEWIRERVRQQYGTGIAEVQYRDNPASDAHVAPASVGKPRAVGKRRARSAAASSAAGKKRQRTGAKFESELNDTHDGFARDHVGHILPHYPPTVQVGEHRVLKAGGGPCDYSGHVNMTVPGGQLLTASELARFEKTGRQIPVVFDAKVLGEEHASYVHSEKRMAQLAHLEHAANAGAVAFLLVRADAVGRVFGISYPEHADALKRREPILLFRQLRIGSREERRLGITRQVPAYETVPVLPSIAYTLGKGWLWHRLLETLVFPVNRK